MKIRLPGRVVLCAVSILAACAGTFALVKYENTAGSTGETPKHWPGGLSISLNRERDTLLMFAHPKCPCTRASIEELNRALARCGQKVSVHVLFFKPADAPAGWDQTDLRQSAAAIPGVEVLDDPDGALARRFGAETSGSVVLYDPQGKLLFTGGITGSRGHEGDNAGQSAIVALLEGRDANVHQTHVYGCSLLDTSCPKPPAP
jgi:hypothetical protein